MMDNSNIMFDADDIEVILDQWLDSYVKIDCDNEEHAEKVKQQILENQKIVERLKESIVGKGYFEYENDPDSYAQDRDRLRGLIIEELESILEESQS